MTPEDLMRSTIGPAWVDEHRASAIAMLRLHARAVPRAARVAGSSERGVRLLRIIPDLVLRSDAKHRVSKESVCAVGNCSRAQLYAGSVAGRELNPSGITF